MAAPRIPLAEDAGAEFLPPHGGALDRAAETYGIPRSDWLDLSTGINPNPWPWQDAIGALADDDWAGDWQRLPDERAERALVAAAARHYGAPDGETVAAAPGSQSLIRLLPRLIAPSQTVAVVEPTYSEHAPSWRDAGHTVRAVGDIGAVDAGDGVVVLCNPNNPDGRRWRPEALFALLGAPGRLLVVDEAFADTDPAFSLAPHAGRPGLVVLRSFGKFFGLAGIRLGFALAQPAFAATIRRALGPWAVSGPAVRVATAALADRAWAETARARIARDGARLDALLRTHGLDVVGGAGLYRLVRERNAHALFERLARQGILTRPFAAMPDWLRIGLPANDDAFARLGRALAALKG